MKKDWSVTENLNKVIKDLWFSSPLEKAVRKTFYISEHRRYRCSRCNRLYNGTIVDILPKGWETATMPESIIEKYFGYAEYLTHSGKYVRLRNDKLVSIETFASDYECLCINCIKEKQKIFYVSTMNNYNS